MGSPTLPVRAGSAPRSRRPIRLPAWIATAVIVLLYTQFYLLPQYFYKLSPTQLRVSEAQLSRLQAGLAKCAEFNTPPLQYEPTTATRDNPRWNDVTGQKGTLVLRNATLFDGEKFVTGAVDIIVKKGIVRAVSADTGYTAAEGMTVLELDGQYVTPGLVDMHSHHLTGSWPQMSSNNDNNEVHPDFGPLTPFLRSLDSMRGDPATLKIASGGITTSLILPGSANIMGGEAFPVKNTERSGENAEEVIEDMLLEHGIPFENRRRYLKMACGENPRRVYKHTRMGNAYKLRQHMTRAVELKQRQDAWCLEASAAQETRNEAAIATLTSDWSTGTFGLPEELELDSTVAMLRGKIGINVHCYEPEDFEDMLRHSQEFGFRVQAFHHALEAWQVPEMIKATGYNTTIATFAEFALYKQEAYGGNLWAGKILSEHDVPVAYKSDHADPMTFAKYLLFQAAVGHSFHLPEDLALQAVTSVPAKSLELDHRVGYVRPGYDADIVVWNSHPLAVGATPLQVYVDGIPLFDADKVADTFPQAIKAEEQPRMRVAVQPEVKSETCGAVRDRVVITGIQKSFLHDMAATGNLTLVLEHGEVACYGVEAECASAQGDTIIALENGHILPGVTAFSTTGFGLAEIEMQDETSDGELSDKVNPLDEHNVAYAKYGVHLEGRLFTRARFGGVTRVVTMPLSSGFLGGVSTGIKTSSNYTILDGGIFQGEVALHFTIGQDAKSTPTISAQLAQLRRILIENKGKDGVYGKAAAGAIPVVVQVENKYDIMQLIRLKQELKINLVLLSAGGAPWVADELAAAEIPVIFDMRGTPNTFEKQDLFVGPPLTKSGALVLSDAGVKFALTSAALGSWAIHDHLLEASWAAKYTGLSEKAAVDLVSRNLEEILGLHVDEAKRDFVIYEGNPLEFGASVVLSVDGENRRVLDCWPDVQ